MNKTQPAARKGKGGMRGHYANVDYSGASADQILTEVKIGRPTLKEVTGSTRNLSRN